MNTRTLPRLEYHAMLIHQARTNALEGCRLCVQLGTLKSPYSEYINENIGVLKEGYSDRRVAWLCNSDTGNEMVMKDNFAAIKL